MFCVLVLPVMKDALQVVKVTVSEIIVSWFSYKPPTSDAGTQSPGVSASSYDVEMTMNDREWTVVGSVAARPQNIGQDAYAYRVGHLIPGTRYRFRLVIVWLNDQKPTRSIPGPPTVWIRTHCGQSASVLPLLLIAGHQLYTVQKLIAYVTMR